jgi:uncharacterized phage protein (TIGR02216 family)
LRAAGQPARPFPWDGIARFGFAVLRLTPEAFWKMTPRELALAMDAIGGRHAPLARTDFEQLLQQFPDGM